MHELGLLTSVVRVVTEATAAQRAGGAAIVSVTLRVGSRSGAVPDALQGAWPIAIAHTPAEGAALVIDEVAAAVWCPACAAERVVDQDYALLCPVCDTPAGELVRGRELAVSHVDLDRPEAADGAPVQPSH